MNLNHHIPAFPRDPETESSGMSLRDYFAAKALAGFLAAPKGKFPDQLDLEDFAPNAYYLADRMIAARVK